ncbi:unnamed protein product [Mucor hiemalis]
MVDEFRTSAMCSFCGEPLATPRAIAPLGEAELRFQCKPKHDGARTYSLLEFWLIPFDGQPIGMPERRFIGADTATAHSLHSAAAATAPPSAAAATWKLSTKRADETF